MKKGDIVKFGRYMDEDLTWIVLKSDKKEALLCSEKVIDVMCFGESSDYEKSFVKEFLMKFYDDSFTDEQKKCFINGEESISILSKKNLSSIGSEIYRLSFGTDYSIKKGVFTYWLDYDRTNPRGQWAQKAENNTRQVSYWLKDASETQEDKVYMVDGNGTARAFWRNSNGGIRPTIILKVDTNVEIIGNNKDRNRDLILSIFNSIESQKMINKVFSDFSDDEKFTKALILINPESFKQLPYKAQIKMLYNFDVINKVVNSVDDKKYVMQLIPDDVLHNKENCLKLFNSSSYFEFSDIPIEFSSDKDVILSVIRNSSATIWSKIPVELKNDKDFMLKVATIKGAFFEHFYKKYQNDIDIARAAVMSDANMLKFISLDLKNDIINDKNVVLAMVNKFGDNLAYASDDLKNDKDVVLTAIRRHKENHTIKTGVSLRKARELLKDSDRPPLQYASDELKNDKDVVLTAVESYGASLEFATNELKNNKDVVLAAISNDSAALQYASDELKHDKDFILTLVREKGSYLKYASDEFKNDKDIVFAAVSKDAYYLQYASDELKNDKDVVLAAVSKNAHFLNYASDELKNDKDVVLAAIRTGRNVLSDVFIDGVSDEFYNDKDVVLALVSNCNFSEIPSGIPNKFKNDKDVVLAAISNDGDALQYASDELKHDKDFILTLVREKGSYLQYASDELKNDKDVVLAAVSNDSDALQYASDELRHDKENVIKRDGKYIYFGSYPQSRVTDEILKSHLSAVAGAPSTWTSYNYYKENSISDFMKYKDITYSGYKYRGVYFTEYRNENLVKCRYHTNTIYWFKYKPIKWKILSESKGDAFLVSDLLLDSQDYNHTEDNNYENSSIRKWLNSTFYNTAFNVTEQEKIKTTNVDNSLASTGYSSNSHVCSNTNDKVFLLSADEVNVSSYSSYGFKSYKSRRKDWTYYAMVQGAPMYSHWWWLRSPSVCYSESLIVDSDNRVSIGNVEFTSIGVAPALHLTLD